MLRALLCDDARERVTGVLELVVCVGTVDVGGARAWMERPFGRRAWARADRFCVDSDLIGVV